MKATTTFFYDWITKGRLFFSNDGDKDDREKTNNSGEIADDHVRSVKKNVQSHHEAYRILPGPIPINSNGRLQFHDIFEVDQAMRILRKTNSNDTYEFDTVCPFKNETTNPRL
jgi:hypothetical protein